MQKKKVKYVHQTGKMNSYAIAVERVRVRLSDPSTATLMLSSLAALGVAVATSEGRKMLPLVKPTGASQPQSSSEKNSKANETRGTVAHDSGEMLLSSPLPEDPESTRGETLQKLLFLLRAAIPSARSKEVWMILRLLLLTMTRIAITLYMGNLMGSLAGSAMEGNMRELFRDSFRLLLTCIPVSVVDATLDYTKEMLELSLRLSLSHYFFQRYLSTKVFFRLAGLHDVENVQTVITDGVERWSATVVGAFHSFTRSGLEAVVFSRALWKRTGWRGPALTWMFYGLFSLYAFRFSPSMDLLGTLRMQKLGAFRTAHQNIRAFAEEIVLSSHKNTFIKDLTGRLFKTLTDHARMASYLHSRFQLGNMAIFRYGSALMSILVGSLGVFRQATGNQKGPSVSALRNYSKTTYTFSVLSTALNHMLINIRIFGAVKGYTHALYDLVVGLDFAQQDAMQSSLPPSPVITSPFPAYLSPSVGNTSPKPFSTATNSVISVGHHIQFIGVPLTLPSGKCICESLNFHVRHGMNLLITGPNGCGKSSTLRLLGELWPLQGGTVIKPPPQEIYYVPQRPYMFDGTLIEQIIYPHRRDQTNVTEERLHELLRIVGLKELFLESKLTWDSMVGETLSSGEKQRLALARLFYHSPQFAILDESSSSMDPDVERTAYENCLKLGISLITVAHRRSVWKYHNWVLRFDGHGGYMFSPLDVDEANEVIHLTAIETSSNEKMIGKSMTFKFEEIVTEDTVLLAG